MEKLYYIQNEGFCGNALFWWRSNGQGYTIDLRMAGKYTREKAALICKRPEDTAWPCEYINSLIEAQKLIIDGQYVDHDMALDLNSPNP